MVDNIIAERDRGGAFKSLSEFCRRVDVKLLNRRAIEIFVKSGAFDSIDKRRTALLTMIDEAVSAAERYQKERVSGQGGLFGEKDYLTDVLVPTVEEKPLTTILTWERETLGFYLTGHPLDEYKDKIRDLMTLKKLGESMSDTKQRPRVSGLIIGLRQLITKRGDTMVYVKLEDLTAQMEVTVFPKLFQSVKQILEINNVIVIDGNLEFYNENPLVVAKKIIRAADYEPNYYLTLADDTPLERIKEICSRYRGECLVRIRRRDEGWKLLGDDYKVDGNAELRKAFGKILGAENVKRL